MNLTSRRASGTNEGGAPSRRLAAVLKYPGLKYPGMDAAVFSRAAWSVLFSGVDAGCSAGWTRLLSRWHVVQFRRVN